jgi:hypothetical protein
MGRNLRPNGYHFGPVFITCNREVSCSNTEGLNLFLGYPQVGFEKLLKLAVGLVMSVCTHGTTRLPLDGFERNLIFEDFLKYVEKNPYFIKI